MDGYVDLVLVRDLFETFVKILHILDQKRSRKCEITLLVL